MFKSMTLWAKGSLDVYFLHVVLCEIISTTSMIFLFNFALHESSDFFQANWHFQSYLAFVHSVILQFAF